MIDFTMRYDGSFNFPEDKRFGLFPSVSVGYTISEEPFMGGIDWLDNLKLRASYGKMGNDDVPNYQYLAQYDYYNAYAFGISPTIDKGFSLATTPNPDIAWEVSTQQNIGFDITVLEGLFNFTFDYFYEKRRQILLSRAAEVPDYTALELPDENFGKVDNSGVELQLTHENSSGDLNYNVTGNFHFNRNKIIDMAEPEGTPEWRQQEGHPIDSWVVYKSDGVYANEQEIENSVHLDGTIPGDINYQDVDGDGEITGNDQIRKYTSPIPEIQFGLDAGLTYKGWDFNIFFQGQTNATAQFFFGESNPVAVFYEKRWTQENRNSRFPRAFLRDDYHNQRAAEIWLQDATFLRLKNATIGYTLPSNMLSSVGVSSLRVYVRGRNIKTWDKMFGHYDPEKSGGISPLPQIMRLTLGANINF
jgi:TonB-linked SusC/RagA family outer membrane protein